MRIMFRMYLTFLTVLMCISGCSNSSTDVVVIKKFSLDSIDDVITQSGVQIDKEVSSDGNGSLKITATNPTLVRLFEVNNLDVKEARLIYRARLKTKDVNGYVYLEMWCNFFGKGEYFSKGLQSPLTGTTNWTTEETIFFLKKGQNPDFVKLNLVIDGKGTVWIDDITLLKAPLN